MGWGHYTPERGTAVKLGIWGCFGQFSKSRMAVTSVLREEDTK